MNRLILAPLAAVLLLATPQVAVGHGRGHKPHPTTTDPVTLAVKLAEAYWHAKPCEGKITLSVVPPLPVSEVSVGQSASEATEGEETMVQAWVNLPSATCVIYVPEGGLWSNWEGGDESFQWFCDTIVHEIGHFPPLNHEDEGQTNPRSIEYPIIEPGSPNYNAVPECRHVTTWYDGRRFPEVLRFA
jgi:hypothetical protein